MGHQTLRIGFIGAGGNTRSRHLPGFAAIENVELATVANRSRASSEAVAAAFGIKRVAEDWRAVIADPQVDAVCIGTWPYLHAEATVAALEAGKHVLCEARMAADLAEARRMQEAAAAHPELVAQVVPAPFSLDHDATIRELLSTGKLGRLLEVIVVHTSGQLADPGAPMTWRQDAALSGRNVLTMGILHETVERWLDDETDWVVADGAVFQASRPDGNGVRQSIEIPDSISILGRFATSGAKLNYLFSGVASGAPRMELRLNGTEGALRFDALAAILYFAAAGECDERVVSIPAGDGRGWQVEADFVRSIREGAPVELTSFARGVRSMKFTEMVADSAAGDSRRVFGADYPG